MKRISFILLLLLAGCGYTLKTAGDLPYRTIFVPTFRNKIPIQEDSPSYRLYYPGLEIELENLLKERFRYDGKVLPVSEPEDADLILRGTILSYDKEALRYAKDEAIEEFRVKIVAEIKASKGEEELWEEKISGEITYFTTGANAQSETEAVQEALKDLSRRIVDRVVEDW